MGFLNTLLKIVSFGRLGKKKEEKKPKEIIYPKVDLEEFKEEKIQPPEPVVIDSGTRNIMGDDFIKREEEKRYKEFKKKQQRKVEGKIKLTKDKISEMEKMATPEDVIKTSRFASHGDLVSSKFEIYRGLILKHISSDKLVQDIYQSGILDNRIVATIYITGYIGDRGNIRQIKGHEIEIQGLTPDKAISLGVLETLKGYVGTWSELQDSLYQYGLPTKGEALDQESYNDRITITDVQISFDYA